MKRAITKPHHDPSGGVSGADGTATFLAHPLFDELDRHFARFLERLAGGARPELALAAALVSHQRTDGGICLDLAAVAGKSLPTAAEKGPSVRCPELPQWLAALRATSVVGPPGEFTPLVLDAHARLYLHRYWSYERSLADALLARARAEAEDVDEELLRAGLERFFPAGGGTDWQKVAAFTAVQRRFCVISGGPGTGKTRTVVLLLALLLEQARGRKLRIAIAAPTGKAAARLQESIKKTKATLVCDPAILAQLPEDAATLHRLLGTIPDSAFFRHDRSNPLPVDVLVVDEASMVDLALMAKLFDAIPPEARVILLGDQDQLASVEAGAVLGDMAHAARANEFPEEFRRRYERVTGESLPSAGAAGPALAGSVVQLRKNYRFGEAGGIHQLSQAVNTGDAERTVALLRGPIPAVAWRATPPAAQWPAALREKILAGYAEVLRAPDPRAALEALNRFRLLGALRQGPHGVTRLNQLAEEVLEESGLIQKTGPWYAGRPVMILRNDYQLKLFNGDIGIAWPDAESRELRVFFLGADQALRRFLPLRLPEHETVYAMTVHKSQGSEFEQVLLILPDRENPLLTRELIYTGLTRASRGVELWADEAVLRAAVARTVTRASGLREALA